jgi:hypothetical protein
VAEERQRQGFLKKQLLLLGRDSNSLARAARALRADGAALRRGFVPLRRLLLLLEDLGLAASRGSPAKQALLAAALAQASLAQPPGAQSNDVRLRTLGADRASALRRARDGAARLAGDGRPALVATVAGAEAAASLREVQWQAGVRGGGGALELEVDFEALLVMAEEYARLQARPSQRPSAQKQPHRTNGAGSSGGQRFGRTSERPIRPPTVAVVARV